VFSAAANSYIPAGTPMYAVRYRGPAQQTAKMQTLAQPARNASLQSGRGIYELLTVVENEGALQKGGTHRRVKPSVPGATTTRTLGVRRPT
jgi:hypothetical protein